MPPGIPSTAATPSNEAPWIAPVVDDEASSLIPGLTEAPPQATGLSEQERRYWWKVLGAAAAALAVLAAVAVLAVSRIGHRSTAHAPPVLTAALTPTSNNPRGMTSSATASASTRAANRQPGLAQASTIADYLRSSRQARPSVGTALRAITACTNIGSAVTTLRNAANVRTRIVTALASTDISALPDGAPAAVADLRRAMQASANADWHYAAWGQTVAGCHGRAPHTAEYATALQSGTAADAAKQRFADEWNPIAARYGLAKQNANTI